ncbi:MAG: hypothetical protein JOY60_18050 [Burkholderiaceae bacterium]|nr:hypothetical protein [Burkholderiaceae bacterium]
MNKFFHLSLLGLALALAGCASGPTWYKPNATTADLSRDRTMCMQKSQTGHMGYQKMNSEGAFNSAHYEIDSNLFADCMYDNGWKQK